MEDLLTDISKGNRKHMTLSDRIIIEQGLNQQMTFKSIAASIEKDPSSISKEIRRYLLWSGEDPVPYKGNDCVHYKTCTIDMLCMWDCPGYCKDCDRKGCNYYCNLFESASCGRLESAPYVCNGCPAIGSCRKTHRFYFAETAQKRYAELLVSSRSGINISPEDLKAMNELISPLIRKGQPLSHIFSVHGNSLNCSRKTVYNYLDQGLFDVRNIDLPRRVRYKLRKQRRKENPIMYDYRRRRTFKEFEKFSSAYPEYEVVEMDTVKGTREAGKCLLTLLFRRSSFMLVFLLPSCTQKAVKDVFDFLYEQLGRRIFMKTFRIILTDNGPEFKDPWSIEKDDKGRRRTFVFYCDPYVSNQKSRIEKNHEFIRYIIPKGRSMHNLTQDDARLIMCHINSVARDSLNGQTPFDLAELLINKKVLRSLGLRKISPDDVILKPALLKK